MQWTGCHEKRHGCNGQGVMVRRDMEVTEIVEDDGVIVRRDMEVTEIVEDDTMDRVSW